jgi:4-hydroxy-4-methyl-2-oxoglutarate aldolase
VSTPAAFASLGEGRVGVLLGFDCAWPSARVLGPAFTAQGAPGDNLALHHAGAQAAPGDVIVLAVDGERARAHCGGIVATAARARAVAVAHDDVGERPADVRADPLHSGPKP